MVLLIIMLTVCVYILPSAGGCVVSWALNVSVLFYSLNLHVHIPPVPFSELFVIAETET